MPAVWPRHQQKAYIKKKNTFVPYVPLDCQRRIEREGEDAQRRSDVIGKRRTANEIAVASFTPTDHKKKDNF
jgi:hypothetical protein